MTVATENNNNNNENSNSLPSLSSISLKVARGEDIRRVAFDGSSSLLSLRDVVAKLYGIEDSSSIVLKHGDVVLTSDSELQEAVKEVKESKVLRISLEIKPSAEDMEDSEEDEDVMRPFGRFKHGRRFGGHHGHGHGHGHGYGHHGYGGPFAFHNPYGPHYYHGHHGPHSHGPRVSEGSPLSYGPFGPHHGPGPHSHGPHHVRGSFGGHHAHGPHHHARPFGPGPHGPFGHGPRFYGHHGHGPHSYGPHSHSHSPSEGMNVNVNVNVDPMVPSSPSPSSFGQDGPITATFHSHSDEMFNHGSFSPIDPNAVPLSSFSPSGCEKANKKWEKYEKRCDKFNKKFEEKYNKKCEKYDKKCEKYDKKCGERDSKWEEKFNKKCEKKCGEKKREKECEKKCEKFNKKCGKMNKWGAFENGRALNSEDEKAIQEAKERMFKLKMEMKAAKRHYIWTLRNAGAPATVESTTEAAAKMSLSDDVVPTN